MQVPWPVSETQVSPAMQSSEDVQVCPTTSCARHVPVPGVVDRSQYAPAAQLQSQVEPIAGGAERGAVHLLWQQLPSVGQGSAEQLPSPAHSAPEKQVAPSAMAPWSTGAHGEVTSSWLSAVRVHGADENGAKHASAYSE